MREHGPGPAVGGKGECRHPAVDGQGGDASRPPPVSGQEGIGATARIREVDGVVRIGEVEGVVPLTRVPLTRIGVVSDTHVPDRQKAIPGELLHGLRGVDLIIHAGDLTTLAVLDVLETIAPVRAVSGNMDPPQVRDRLGKTALIQVAGKTIGIMHGQGAPGETEALARQSFPEADVVVFGHTHRWFLEYRGSTLIFNPGPAVRGVWWKASYGILYIVDDPEEPVKAEIYPI